MLLKSLEIQGFKSFPDKTKLTFGAGITAVVGPNGSGKSNISDAVRWVLGEQSTRTLRGAKMEDVVFAGAATRKAQGFAEVSLTIDNSDRRIDFDKDTVTVTRRYYRSGDSEYMLNKTNVRLKDINELFMDTGLGRDGYSIIGQGKIADIVASRSEDRREIFEEAAGISKYRYRKHEAERRLEKAEENLVRLRDILSELESRVGPLREQAEKAQKFLVYAEQKRGLEIGIWMRQIDRASEVLRDHEQKILVAQGQHDELEKKLNSMESEMEEVQSQSARQTALIDEIRRSSSRLEEEAVRMEGQVQVLENTVSHNRQSIARLQEELKQSASTDEGIRQEIEQRQEKIRDISQRKIQLSKKLEDVRQEMEQLVSQSAGHSSQMESLSASLNRLVSKAADARVEAVTAQSSIQALDQRMEAVARTLEQQGATIAQAKDDLEDLEQGFDQLEDEAQSLQNAVKGYEIRVASRREKVAQCKRSADQLRLDASEMLRRISLLEEMERSLEGFTQSVKLIMKQAKRGVLRGIHGPVSHLIQVPGEYALAVETALGGAMQNIVTSTEADAKAAIQHLKSSRGGRATFLPIGSIQGRRLQESGLDDCWGFVGLAADLIQFDRQYEGIFLSLLGRTVVAEDLDSATAIAKRYHYRFRVVTLDGQVVNAGGSLTGGSHVKGAGLLSRRNEIDTLRQKADHLSSQAEEAKSFLHTAEQDLAAAEAQLSGAKGELATVNEDKIRLESELKRLKEQLLAAQKNEQELKREVARSSSERENLLKKQEDAMARADQIYREKAQLETRMAELAGGQDELQQKRENLAAQSEQIRLDLLASQKDLDAFQNIIQDLKGRLEGQADREQHLRQEMESYEAQNGAIACQIQELTAEAAEKRSEAQGAGRRIDQINERRSQLERRFHELRQEERSCSAQREAVSRELARLEERKQSVQRDYDSIVKKLWDEYELTRREAQELASPVEELSKAQRELNEIKAKIKALGNVNVGAVEEYKEVSGRYEFLREQIDDAERARGQLYQMIHDLTTKMQDLFLDRFRQINQNFGEIFAELFGGGRVSLRLTDPEDVLRSGIEISVQPPGKIITHLDSLSGGEKALVAIALYFAILRVSPACFCILDEIEAALDDVNVDRFAAYLRRMCENTQFIVITHRRGTMEEADVLYGVTMQEEGVSKLLELKASEVEEKLGLR
ncbi:chromosome segregation protein SMC [[Clostridium] leptum]|nr:chromosome segregation protein SMC [[Clostridium] leptum]